MMGPRKKKSFIYLSWGPEPHYNIGTDEACILLLATWNRVVLVASQNVFSIKQLYTSFWVSEGDTWKNKERKCRKDEIQTVNILKKSTQWKQLQFKQKYYFFC